MNKVQTLHEFWNSFGVPAYSAETVPDTAVMPYITYEVATDSIGYTTNMIASIWFRSYSWSAITELAEEIAEYIVNMYPATVKIDGGRLYITKGTPFAQRISDEDDAIRRIVLSIDAEYLTNY